MREELKIRIQLIREDHTRLSNVNMIKSDSEELDLHKDYVKFIKEEIESKTLTYEELENFSNDLETMEVFAWLKVGDI